MADNKLVKYDFGKNCVCVGRISTSSQSHTAQLKDLTDLAHSLGYKKIQPFFTTESGFLEVDDKQGWNLVVDFFDSHPDYRVLICTEISRLSRREYILHMIKDYLSVNKIQLIIKDINYTLFNEWGEIPKGNDIIFSLYASLADSEMRQKKERFTRSLKDNRELGYSIGGKELFGYKRYYELKDGRKRSKYEINEKEADEIRTIYRWYAFGIDGVDAKPTVLSITRECIERGFSQYLHSKRNVNKCLKEKAYCGQKETHNRVKNPDYWNYHKPNSPKYIEAKSYICTYPIIFDGDDAALFNLVQQRLKQNNSKYTKLGESTIDKSSKHTTLLAKLVKCPNCGTYLTGEYSLKKHPKRPHLEPRETYMYRCSYSRSMVHTCSFTRCFSMPLLDSVVWSYCRNAVQHTLQKESNTDVRERTAEIETKIANLQTQIDSYDIEQLINTESSILRTKIRVLKDNALIEEATKQFETNIKKIEKELNVLKSRKLELEEEKKAIVNNTSYIDRINRTKDIEAQKKLLYKYIHRVVQRVEIITWGRFYVVLKIHLKKTFIFQRKYEYVCLFTKSTRNVQAIVLSSYNQQALAEIESKVKDLGEWTEEDKKMVIRNIPSSDALKWDNEEGRFRVNDFAFTIDELKDYYEHPHITINPLNPQLGDALVGAPIRVIKMDIERLTCYGEDSRLNES